MLGFLFDRPRPYRTAAELAEAMMSAIKASPDVSRVEVSSEDFLQLKVFKAGPEASGVHLHNAVAHLLGHRLSGVHQDREIARFVASIVNRPAEIPLIVGNLMPCVRHIDFVEAVREFWGDHPERDAACYLLNGDLSVVLMQDLGESYATTNPAMFESSGTTPSDGLREAKINFARLATTRVIENFAKGVWFVSLTGEELMSISLLAFSDELDAIQRELGLSEALLAAPTRNGILIGGPDQREVLRSCIKRSQNEGHFQSACIFGRIPGQANLGYIEHWDGADFVVADSSGLS